MRSTLRAFILLPLTLLVTLPPVRAQTETAKLFANDGYAGDSFGAAASLSGNRALISAYRDSPTILGTGDYQGSAYLFERNMAGGWVQVAKLAPSDGKAGDYFGYSVSLSGDRALIGAILDTPATAGTGTLQGSAYIFERNSSGAWVQVALLAASDGFAGDYFGGSVSLSGDRALVGARRDNPTVVGIGNYQGSAYLFERNTAGVWAQVAKLAASDGYPSDMFAGSVSLSGDRALIGAYADAPGVVGAGNYKGSAYLFERNMAGAWVQVAKLKASDGHAADYFGISTSLSGDRALIGAYGDDPATTGDGNYQGSAYLFERELTGAWVQVAKLAASDGYASDIFAGSVSLSGDRALISAGGDDPAIVGSGNHQGSGYLFERTTAGAWIQVAKFVASDGFASDMLTVASLSGDRALMGAYGDDPTIIGNGNLQGAAYVYELPPLDPWTDLGSGLAGVAGVPVLVGTGTLAPGTTGSLTLGSAAAFAPALLFVSLASTPLPAKGGVLLAYPELVKVPLVTDGAGSVVLPWIWPSVVPPQTALYCQYLIQDAAATHGVALSNAVKGLTP